MPKYPWKKPKSRINTISLLAWPFKTATAYPELLVESIHRALQIGRKKSSFTPYQTKNHISIPDKDETKTTLQPLQLPTTPKRRRKIIYKQQNYHSLLGKREMEGSPPPLSQLKEVFSEQRKKIASGIERGRDVNKPVCSTARSIPARFSPIRTRARYCRNSLN
jgi:hypothetical protein